MKIGILTFTDGTNIGQRLQNYALQHTIESLNEANEVYTIKQGYPFNPIKRDIKKIISFLKCYSKEVEKIKRQKKFDEFNEKYIKFYYKQMPFYGDNSKFANEFDCFVVGSDQIWNPNSPFVGDNFFLPFAKKEQRLTYAPSFSTETIPREKIHKYIDYMNGFSSLTVREDKGREIIYDLIKCKADVVIDPTLLLGRHEYNHIKKQSGMCLNGEYIMAFFLGDIPRFEIDTVGKELGLRILEMTSSTVVGPDEFIDLIENCSVVLTDSYHVTALSIIYQRPFVNFVRSGKGVEMNSRFDTLFRLLNIKHRTWEYLKSNLNEIKEMRYDSIYQKLEQERHRCRTILEKELENVLQ